MCPHVPGKGSSSSGIHSLHSGARITGQGLREQQTTNPEPQKVLVACQALVQRLPCEGASSHGEFHPFPSTTIPSNLPSQFPHTPEENSKATGVKLLPLGLELLHLRIICWIR